MSSDVSAITKKLEGVSVRDDVSLDIAAMMIDDSPVEDVRSYETLFPKLDLSRMMANRLDVCRYLRNLTDDPKEALEVMLLTQSFLSGSRAVDFFTPGLATDESDWDVYCIGGRMQTMLLVSWVNRIGFRHIPKTPDDVDHENAGYIDIGLRVLDYSRKNGDAKEKLQLIISNQESDIGVILNFHSTIVRCMITGWGAVSACANFTRYKKGVEYSINPLRNSSRIACVEKFKTRGVVYIRLKDAAAEKSVCHRTLDDENSTIIPMRAECFNSMEMLHLAIAQRKICEKASWTDYNADGSANDLGPSMPILKRMYRKEYESMAVGLVRKCYEYGIVVDSDPPHEVPGPKCSYEATGATTEEMERALLVELEEHRPEASPIFREGVAIAERDHEDVYGRLSTLFAVPH